MRPTLDEARYKFALERLAEATGRDKGELDDEITEEAELHRKRP